MTAEEELIQKQSDLIAEQQEQISLLKDLAEIRRREVLANHRELCELRAFDGYAAGNRLHYALFVLTWDIWPFSAYYRWKINK
jgi:hypothetical protein